MNAPQAPTQLEPLLLEARTPEGVVTLTLNRPAQFNTLSEEMLAALHEAAGRLAADKGARVVVIAGAGKAFCAGHDLKEIRALQELPKIEGLFSACSRMMQAIHELPQPVIAYPPTASWTVNRPCSSTSRS